MTRSHRLTEEQITAAQLRVLLDQKQGRTTPDVVRTIAKSIPGDKIPGIEPPKPESVTELVKAQKFTEALERIRELRAAKSGEPNQEEPEVGGHASAWFTEPADKADVIPDISVPPSRAPRTVAFLQALDNIKESQPDPVQNLEAALQKFMEQYDEALSQTERGKD
ncbi:hypothetical protein [Amycolatopsis sp. w19]|uniref:hypothetical protein n=1 Tax=Amycolatopsis sp. w19 TaxID=3448134 RepID=UPI003F1A9EE3